MTEQLGRATPSTQRRGQERRIDGVLVVDKPEGMTSMDVVRRIKRASRVKKVGHGGTLDPFATGVIAVCMGQATRMMGYLVDGAKTYRGVVEMGIETDTYDVQGEITRRTDASGVTLSDVEAALSEFRGVILQVPPMYSALKHQGKRLYDLARAGVEVEREPRRVEVTDISVVDWSPPLMEVSVECGRGFYMRSLAFDLGANLACGAYLKSLVRMKSGTFDIADAVSLDEAERSFDAGDWHSIVRAPDSIVERMRALIVGKREELHLHQGRPLAPSLKVPPARHGERRRVYTTDGGFVGIVSFDAPGRRWQPQRVLSINYPRETTA